MLVRISTKGDVIGGLDLKLCRKPRLRSVEAGLNSF